MKPILADEMRELMHTPPSPLNLPEPPLGIKIDQWPPHVAERLFLAEYHGLGWW